MKNTGFTLVELLGAIVVLALLSLLTIPVVTNIVKENKQKLYDTQIKNIESAAEAWSGDNLDGLPDKGQYITLTLEQLQKEGYVEKNIKNPKTGNKLENLNIYIYNVGNQYLYKAGELPVSVLYEGYDFRDIILKKFDPKFIGFYSNGNLPEGITKEKLLSMKNETVSDDNKVKAYFDYENRSVYIYSENYIYANPNSTAMFNQFGTLKTIYLEELDTSKVTNMSYMFDSCTNLTNLDLSNFDTSNVTNMESMFGICKSLTNLDLSNFDTSKVTVMSYMFNGCESLTNLDLSNFDTSKVTDMEGMFDSCESLTNLDLSSFDTSKVTFMSYMFKKCLSLTSLDLSSFDTINVESMRYMFQDSSNLKTITVSDKWVIISSTDTTGMFESCGTDKVTIK